MPKGTRKLCEQIPDSSTLTAVVLSFFSSIPMDSWRIPYEFMSEEE